MNKFKGFFQEILQGLREVGNVSKASLRNVLLLIKVEWSVHSPAMHRKAGKAKKAVGQKMAIAENWFTDLPFDRKLALLFAVLISFMSVLALTFGTLLGWLSVAKIILGNAIAWAIVYRKYTGPAIHKGWNWSMQYTKPFRARVTLQVKKILFGKYGSPVEMIGWGVIFLTLCAIFAKINMTDTASLLGLLGFGGIIFGLFFQAVKVFHQDDSSPKAH